MCLGHACSHHLLSSSQKHTKRTGKRVQKCNSSGRPHSNIVIYIPNGEWVEKYILCGVRVGVLEIYVYIPI
jgi:hypothetical protein